MKSRLLFAFMKGRDIASAVYIRVKIIQNSENTNESVTAQGISKVSSSQSQEEDSNNGYKVMEILEAYGICTVAGNVK